MRSSSFSYGVLQMLSKGFVWVVLLNFDEDLHFVLSGVHKIFDRLDHILSIVLVVYYTVDNSLCN